MHGLEALQCLEDKKGATETFYHMLGGQQGPSLSCFYSLDMIWLGPHYYSFISLRYRYSERQ